MVIINVQVQEKEVDNPSYGEVARGCTRLHGDLSLLVGVLGVMVHKLLSKPQTLRISQQVSLLLNLPSDHAYATLYSRRHLALDNQR